MRPLQFGRVRIDKVPEIDQLWVDARWLYPGLDLQLLERHGPALGPRLVDVASMKLCLSFHSYLIRLPGRNILVDTCNGNHKQRPASMAWQHQLTSNRYLAGLAALGLQPEDIDFVLCTHLHTDHVGWNTRLEDGRWVPTFPNARYVFSRAEFSHWEALFAAGPADKVGHGSIADSVMPVVEAGLVDLVEAGHSVVRHLDDHVWLEASPGHTPGHVSVHLEAAGSKAVLSGDVVHHPIAVVEPALYSIGDFDRDLARRTRLRLFEHCADSNAWLLAAHFPAPTAGRVCDSGNGRFSFAFA